MGRSRCGICILLLLAVAMVAVATATPCFAQTPTPPPDIPLTIVDGAQGQFAIEQSVSYGEAGIIVTLIFVAGVLLMQMAVEVAKWLME